MKKNLAVVGLGYVGLPVAVLASQKGWNVTGVDVNAEKVDQINAGKSPLDDQDLTNALKSKPLTATTDPAAVAEASVIVVAVPTPVTDDHLPDLEPLRQAIISIAPAVKPDQLVSIESTINPGVMDEVVKPLLEEHAPHGIPHLVHCPERINPGDTTWTVATIPRVLGGYTQEGTALAQQFYESILEAPVKVMDSVTEAEAVKIFENTFRDINIAYVNEMAKSFDKLGIDIINVITGASTKPFGFLAHYPGNGVGGHCISVDPYYMIERARQVGFTHRFLQLARDINDSMPAYAIERMEEGLKKQHLSPTDARIALLGLSYKKDIDDTRESPALEIKRLLDDKDYSFTVFDPHVPSLSTAKSLAEALNGANVIMLATDHREFLEALKPKTLHAAGVKVIIDGKNTLPKKDIIDAGIAYFGIGRS